MKIFKNWGLRNQVLNQERRIFSLLQECHKTWTQKRNVRQDKLQIEYTLVLEQPI
jgi:hypothetical protein